MNDSILEMTNNSVDSLNQYIDIVKTRITEEMMDIKSFVTVINYDIDPLFVDEQWAMLNSRRPDELIPLSQPMLSRLNFSRTSTLITKLQQLFPALRTENNEYWGDGNNVRITIICAGVAAQNKKVRRGRNSKQINMTKGAYKQLLMETQTDAARSVRKYYICLEELFVQYLLYQRAYEVTKSQLQVNFLTKENNNLSTKLDIVIAQNNGLAEQNNGLAEQNTGLSKQLDIQNQKLDTLAQILYKESDNKVLGVQKSHKKQELVVLCNKTDRDRCEVLRGQRYHVQSTLKRKQNEMDVVGKLNTYNNPINLYNRFSERKDERFKIKSNKVVLKHGSTPNDLLNTFHDLNDDKYTVAEEVKNAL